MKKLLTLSILASSLAWAGKHEKKVAAPAEPLEKNKIMGAKIYDLKNNSEQIYTMSRSDAQAGNTQEIITVYTNSSGGVDVVEKSVAENAQFKKYIIEQKQLNAVGEIEIKGSEVHFTYTKNGKTSTQVEKLKDNFVTSPTIVGYLQKHWEQIAKGEAIDVRYGVADRQETVGFEFKKVAEHEQDGKKIFQVRMKPSSFLIAALVKPLHFYFEAEGAKLVKIEGRIPPKQKSGDRYKDLDALSVYYY